MLETIRHDAEAIAACRRDALAPLSGTHLLVTGAAGFLCSFLVDTIVALNKHFSRPCRVTALDNYRTALPARIEHLADDPNVTFLRHDITEPLSSRDRFDWIIHGASIASPTFYRRYPLDTIDANVTGTRRMLDLARSGTRGVMILSSSEIYGDPDPAAVPTSEEYLGRVSCTGPRACYDESKRLAETLAFTYYREFAVPVKIIRPFNVYGPGQRLDDARIVPDLISAVIEDRPITLYSDGRATRAFCYVADAVTAILLILVSEIRGEAFNVGNDEEITIAALASLTAGLSGSPNVTVEYAVSPDADYVIDNPQRRCPDLSKITRMIGWRPEVSLHDGLARTLASYSDLRMRGPVLST
jgi:dTDP-glucose 4,6-dehydratase/UDP-glucuronate decarboxylase